MIAAVPSDQSYIGFPGYKPQTRFRAFPKLSAEDQKKARQRFSPHGRRDGWEMVENWAFSVNGNGKLLDGRFIEPAFTYHEHKPIPEVWW